jgi:hypothetical protein
LTQDDAAGLTDIEKTDSRRAKGEHASAEATPKGVRSMWQAITETVRAIRESVGSWARTARFTILVATISICIVATTAGMVWIYRQV